MHKNSNGKPWNLPETKTGKPDTIPGTTASMARASTLRIYLNQLTKGNRLTQFSRPGAVDQILQICLASVPTVSCLQVLDPLLLCIIPSRVETIRPRICCIIISRRRITNVRNEVLDIKDISSLYMARQL